DGGWNEFFSRSVSFPVAPLQASLDEPAPGAVFAGAVRFAGLSMMPQLAIMDLQLRIGDAVHPCRFGLNRDDVAHAFPDIPTSRRSGFEATLAATPGEHRVALRAWLEDGSELEFVVPRPIVVRPRPLSER